MMTTVMMMTKMTQILNLWVLNIWLFLIVVATCESWNFTWFTQNPNIFHDLNVLRSTILSCCCVWFTCLFAVLWQVNVSFTLGNLHFLGLLENPKFVIFITFFFLTFLGWKTSRVSAAMIRNAPVIETDLPHDEGKLAHYWQLL